jgi:hypothetical protein
LIPPLNRAGEDHLVKLDLRRIKHAGRIAPLI